VKVNHHAVADLWKFASATGRELSRAMLATGSEDHGADGFPLGLKILVAALQADGEMRFNLENSDGNPRR
jgi:hypothetical protein